MDIQSARELAQDWRDTLEEAAGNPEQADELKSEAAEIERRIIAAGYEPLVLLNGEQV